MLRVDGGRLVRRSAPISHRDARNAWTQREGVVLELQCGALRGAGEASPLPGFSADDLATCVSELEGCWERLAAVDVDADADIADILRDGAARAGARSPAAVFAVETALLDVVSRARRAPAWAVLRGDDRAAEIPLSALIDGPTPAALAEAAQRAHGRGIRVVKVKIGGPQGIAHDVERLKAVRERLGDAVALRLDANGMLKRDGLEETLHALAALAPELLEEPTAPEHMFAVAPSPVPLAMDESLLLEGWDARIRKAAALHTHVAVVLKPMVLGGFLRSLAIAEAAAAAGLGVLVTHVFDGSIGSTAAACLALAVRGRVFPCGLDAHGRFDELPTGLTASHVMPYAAYGLGVVTS